MFHRRSFLSIGVSSIGSTGFLFELKLVSVLIKKGLSAKLSTLMGSYASDSALAKLDRRYVAIKTVSWHCAYHGTDHIFGTSSEASFMS